jgi:hypothetical protein
MDLENQKLGSGRSFPSKPWLVALGLLALVLSMPAMTHVSFAATGASVSMSYSVNKVGTQAYITVEIEARDSAFPNSVTVSMTSYYDGSNSPFNVQSVVTTAGPQGGVVHDFVIPYEGAGDYIFTGSISNAKGTVLVSATIDPIIEPEWR